MKYPIILTGYPGDDWTVFTEAVKRPETLLICKVFPKSLIHSGVTKTTRATFYGQGGLKHMEDVYQMRLLPGTDHEMGHFWENPCHENNVKFLPL